MGLLAEHREHEFEKAHAAWAQHVDEVRDMAAKARSWTGEAVDPGDGIIAKHGEMSYLSISGAGLIEPRRLPGHYTGRSQGFSIPVYKGIRYRVGATKGTYQPGPEAPTTIDRGVVLISDQRVVFAGTAQQREWLYPKLIGFHHDEHQPWTAIQVSNRQKVSGIAYTEAAELTVRFRFELALAQFDGTRETFAASIDQQLAQLIAAEPTDPAASHPPAQSTPAQSPPVPPAPTQAAPAPSAPEPSLPPAGWYPNPDGPGRRYWDGAAWTASTAS